MDDLRAVHPQLRSIAKNIPKIHLNKFTLFFYRQVSSLFPRANIPKDIEIKNIYIEQTLFTPKLKLRVYRPKQQGDNVPALLWMHGGGLVFGNPILNDANLIQFVQALGIVIIAVDYRLAPEHPYPLPLEDCYAALKWAYEHADELGIDKLRISIGGESAGGGLAAALAQLALDQGEVPIKFQMLVYPMLDDRSAMDEKYKDRFFFGWNQNNNYFGWKSYLGQEPGIAALPDYAAPSRRKNLCDLPPAWICCGTLDLFYDEDKEYTYRMINAGVNCEFYSMEGVFHGFDSIFFRNPFVIDFRARQIDVLRRNLF